MSSLLTFAFQGYNRYLPLHFMHRSVPQEEPTSLYAVSGVCLVSSIRDGMNLVACECTATRKDKHGVLLLSEFHRCRRELAG
jgi:trehalose-6-phosphate synthase